jgi:hypothetical protein
MPTRRIFTGEFGRTLLVIGALTCVLLVSPGLAWASNTQDITVPGSAVGTVSADPYDMTVFRAVVPLGRSVQATVTSEVTAAPLDLWVVPSQPKQFSCLSPGAVTVSPGVQVIRFTASLETTSFGICVMGTPDATFTINVGQVATQKIHFTKIFVPRKGRKHRLIWVSATIRPGYFGFDQAVRFIVRRKVGSKWVAFSMKGGFIPNTNIHTRSIVVPAALVLPKGTYRVRARFIDGMHPRGMYSASRRIVVR